VAELVEELLKHWPGKWEDHSDPKQPHEASLLNLAIDKAYHTLKWSPVWNFTETIRQTTLWYRQISESPADAPELTRKQILLYTKNAQEQGLCWSLPPSRP
jgi:CDP-glucose 4,6-dehydratase